MNEEQRRVGIAQDMRRSEETLAVARMLCEAGHFNDALSRLYYALFHAMTALLLASGVEPRRHPPLPSLLGMHAQGPDGLSAADLAVVARAASHRDLADYERTWNADAAIAAAAFAEVEPVIERARAILEREGWWSRTSA